MLKNLPEIFSKLILSGIFPPNGPSLGNCDQNVFRSSSFRDYCPHGSAQNVTRLPPPKDPYSGDSSQNYLYEQACYQSATERSTRYESPIVRSKMFHTFYTECLTTVWPKCEVVNAKHLVLALTPYCTFKVNDVVAQDVSGKPATIAHKSGFLVERLLEPRNHWHIFWHPSKPKTDIERFRKIKFASFKDLCSIQRKNITNSIRKFQNAGIEESHDKLHIIERLPNGEHNRIMNFKKFKDLVERSLETTKILGLSPRLARGDTSFLRRCLGEYLPKKSTEIASFPKDYLVERIRPLYPLYTVIKPGFPAMAHYTPFGMKPINYPYNVRSRSFIAALLDEKGNFLDDPKKEVIACLVIYFDSIKAE